jgi:hypothetical protein
MGRGQVTATILGFILNLVIVPILVIEFTDWLPWLATRMIRAAARILPLAARERYSEEWLAELEAIPGGGLSKLAFAIRICIRARLTAVELRGGRSSSLFRRAFDRTAAFAGLIALAPLLMELAVLYKLEGNRPVLQRRIRLSQDQRAVTVYSLNLPTGPRLEKLRAALVSLESLPVLLNVLRGDFLLSQAKDIDLCLRCGSQMGVGNYQPLCGSCTSHLDYYDEGYPDGFEDYPDDDEGYGYSDGGYPYSA